MIVVDSSAFIRFLIKEEGWERLIPYLNPGAEPCSVDLLIIETANAIWKYVERFKRIDENQGLNLLERVMKLVEEDVLRLESALSYLREAWKISLRYRITVYDSLFIAQARSLNVKLITSDRKQVEVAQDLGVETVLIE